MRVTEFGAEGTQRHVVLMDIHRRMEWLKRYNTELSSDVDLTTKIEAYEHEALVDAYGEEAVEEIVKKI